MATVLIAICLNSDLQMVAINYIRTKTPHFLIFIRSEAPSLIVVHWFAPEEIDANIGDYFIQELKPFGILVDAQDFGESFWCNSILNGSL